MRYLFLFLFSFSLAAEVHSDWSFYSLGNFTSSLNLPHKVRFAQSSSAYNVGPYSDSYFGSNFWTELSAVFSKDKIEYHTTLTTDSNPFFGGTVPFAFQNNYLLYRDAQKNEYWVGKRAYRGTFNHLSFGFTFDEVADFMAVGSRWNLGNGFFTEVAAGFKDSGSYSTNDNLSNALLVLVNKVEKQLENGRLKSNIEVYANSASAKYSYVVGLQMEQWDISLLKGSLYFNAFAKYGQGSDLPGRMSGPNQKKLYVNLNGDWKRDNLVLNYHSAYQHVYRTDSADNWDALDVNVQPLYLFNRYLAVGTDLAWRKAFVGNSANVGDAFSKGDNYRASLFVENKVMDGARLRLSSGYIKKHYEDDALVGVNDKTVPRNYDYFWQLLYEMSV